MDKDEKIIEAINYIKEQQKVLADFVIKGVLIHLAITAFSITLYFQGKNVPSNVIQLTNIAVTLLSSFFSIIIYKEGKKVNHQIVELFSKADIKLGNFQIKSWYWISACYVIASFLLILFWISLWFVDFHTVVQP